MTSSSFIKAVVACTTGIALVVASPSTAIAAEWTSVSLGNLTGYIATVAHRPDGRFIFGTNGEIYTQNAFGGAAKTKVNRGTLVFDPSFIAVNTDTSALIGAGGFSGASGLFGFNPTTPLALIGTTPLATVQNYAAVYWHSPTTANEGWLIGGANGAGSTHNITFVSANGTFTGAVTAELSDYSAGMATDSAGNLYTALSENFSGVSYADNKQVLKFTAAQVEAAVAAILAGGPAAPIAKASGTLVYTFDNSASIAVDSLGRVWAAGYETSTLQLYDPTTTVMRRITPVHPALANAAGPPSYAVQTFARSGVNYVSCVASDSLSYLSSNSALYLAYTPVSALNVKPEFETVQSFPTARVGSAYNYQVVTTLGSLQGTMKYVAHGLPDGLKINASSGLITGTPTTPGESAEVWFTVTNAAGVASSFSYVINVEDYAALAHGTFVGLYDRALASTSSLGGRLDLSTTPSAGFTGKLTLGRKSYPIGGVLNTSGSAVLGDYTITRLGLNPLTVSFTINATTGALTGTLNDGTMPSVTPTAMLSGWRVQTSTPLTGLHNFAAIISGSIPTTQPQGSSFGSVTVTAAGKATVAGRAADGSVIASVSGIGAAGEVLIYQPLYTVVGSFSGTLSIAADAPRTITGNLTWSHPPQTSGTLFKDGWTPAASLTVNGGKYRPVSGTSIVMSLPASLVNNAKLTVTDGGIEAIVVPSPVFNMRITAPAKVTIAAPHSVTINNATGAITASVKAGTGTTARTLSVMGLIIPNTASADPFDGQGEGYFLVTPPATTQQRSGKVVLSGLY